MGDKTPIAWTDATWSPVTGCTPVSEGCQQCYARTLSKRFGWDFSKVALHPDRLEIPLHWRKPRMVFVPSMGDLFHDAVPDWFIAKVFGTMALAQQHTFQVLTKRPERMRKLLARKCHFCGGTQIQPDSAYMPCNFCSGSRRRGLFCPTSDNVWLGVSVENQARADERIPLLLDTPAAVRFVSAEPLLGPLNLACLHTGPGDTWFDSLAGEWYGDDATEGAEQRSPRLDWVIVGGESGGPPERRLVERCMGPMTIIGKPDCKSHQMCGGTGWLPKPEALRWIRDIRDQCQAAGVPFFFKQWGPRAGQGTLLDGVEHREMPEVRA